MSAAQALNPAGTALRRALAVVLVVLVLAFGACQQALAAEASEATLTYTASPDEIKEMLDGLPQGIARALTWMSDDMTDLQKAQALHDYLVRNVVYDIREYDNAAPASSHHPYGALCLSAAVCESYARAYEMLLNRVGVECIFTKSAAMYHSWNMMKIGDGWYHVDVTWDEFQAVPVRSTEPSGGAGEVVYKKYEKG